MEHKDFHDTLERFVDYTCNELGIEKRPTLKYKSPEEQGEQPSFAAYSPSTKEVIIITKGRHLLDVMRSLAHELVHAKQDQDGLLGKNISQEGSTGSDIENDANAGAGIIMRHYGKANPHLFSLPPLTEDTKLKRFSEWKK
jgi:Zn-dependent peptidase ImmA (M78 family)